MKRGIFLPILFCIFFCNFTSILAQQGKINYLLDELKVARADTARIRIFNELSVAYRNNDIKKSYDYAQRALVIADKNNSKKGRANALWNLGAIYYRQAKYDTAIIYHEEALEIRQKIDDQKGIASSFNSIALIEAQKGNYAKALGFHLKSLNIREKLGDKRGMASSYNNIGNIYIQQKNYDLAIDNYERALKINQEINDEAQEATYLGNLGYSYMLKKNFVFATDYMLRSLNISEKNSDNYMIINNFINLGNTYKEQKKYPIAFDYLNKAMEKAREMNVQEAKAEIMQIMADIYLAQGDLDKAIENASQSLSIAQQVKNKERILNSSNILYQAYKQKQDIPKALLYHEMFATIKDSIAKQTNDNVYAELEARFRLEQNEILVKEQKQEMELMKKLQAAAEEQQKRQRYLNIGVGIIILFLLIFGVLVYRNYLLRQQHNNRLASVNHELRLQKEEISNQRNLIEHQNHDLKERNSQISKSIEAALYIQQGILPNKQKLDSLLGSDNFVIFHPRNIVSGDFYWIGQLENRIVLAVGDCTGHGVPGAFMSIIGSTLLDRIVRLKKICDPSLILTNLDQELKTILRKEREQSDNGMDVGIICLEKNDIEWKRVIFSGAKIPFRFIRKGNREVEQIQAVNRSIGFVSKKEKDFINHEIYLEKGSQIYLSSDGYADQDNVRHERLGTNRFLNLISECAERPMYLQQTYLEDSLQIYQGNAPQRDDIVVVGLKLS
ncbi:tetratricopeptide repeat protein [Thermoflexibacter ruber]|uniref:Serine phosphatase RsbU, regulator of sigma subunit n=1 Tax=Thermoflexibacter ruber TaxID=1003 RepID=A0A1I2HGL6_9BACT|nr:tetratricopeptide repeat protein [Thermoflexibacter ruber]SFF29405.1 Serine phosphatase RsbU, regulator of sigma subunit [Thermoflexibacter ruber]